MTSLVLTFVGHDKPGLVKVVSEKVASAGGSWLESRLARLAGEFAGVVLINVPELEIAALTAALRALEEHGLQIMVRRGSAEAAETNYNSFELALLGHDRPGIVRDVTQALNQLGANIDEFSSHIESAPFTGETMFRAAARLSVPDAVTQEQVRTNLQMLANEMMVDLAASTAKETLAVLS